MLTGAEPRKLENRLNYRPRKYLDFLLPCSGLPSCPILGLLSHFLTVALHSGTSMNRNRCPVKPYPVKALAACTPRNSGFGGNSGAGRNSHARNSHAAIAPGKAPERALGTFSGDFPASLRAPLRAPLRERLQSSSLVSSFLGARMRSAVSMLLLSAGLGLASPEVLRAAPEGGRVLQGEGEISYEEEGRRTVVRQSGSKLVVDWDRFDVGAEESVHFAQPGRESSVLNRIFDTKASEIYGRLTASGRVWLVNGHGVYFAPGARVNVGGLVASSLDVDPGEFMSGRYVLRRQAGAPSGRVVNRGLLEAARGGFVGLAGSEVSNEGLIYAQAGRIELATGERIEVVDFDGDGLLGFAVQEGVLAGSGKVENSGELRAQGGEVYLKGSVAREVLEGVVNNSGVIQASRVSRRGGKIVLEGVGGGVLNSGELEVSGESGERGGEVKLSGDWVRQEGEVEASGEREGGRVALKAKGLLTVEGVLRAGSSKGKGGTLVLEGERVRLGGESELDVSGAIGGGRIYLGGGRQGQDAAIENARNTEVAEGAVLRADALVKGDGGEVIVWAEEKTSYQGSISARGGEEGGDGGFAEVSAKWLQYGGAVDLRAPRGKVGKLLLDPVNVRICNAGNTAVPCTHNNTNIFTGAAITTMLAGSNLEISTGATGTDPGNIALESDVVITWPSSARTLTLTAANDIILAGTLTGNSVATSTLDLNFGGTLDFSGLSDPGTDISNLSLRATGSGSGATLKGLKMYRVTGVNSGVLPEGGGNKGSERWRFSSVRNLEGTEGADNFSFWGTTSCLVLTGDSCTSDVSQSGKVLGGGGNDSLIGTRVADTVHFTLTIGANADDSKMERQVGANAAVTVTKFSGIEDFETSAGNDTFNVNAPITGSLRAYQGDDTFNVAAAFTGLIVGAQGQDTFNINADVSSGSGAVLAGDEGNDIFNFGENAAVTITGTVRGGVGEDTFNIRGEISLPGNRGGIRGEGGADTLSIFTGGQISEDLFYGEDGADELRIMGDNTAYTYTINSSGNTSLTRGGLMVAGLESVEKLFGGGSDADTLRVTGNTAATYTLGNAENTLAQVGTTTVLSFSDIEILEGGDGADTFNIEVAYAGDLRGGAGADTFVFSATGSAASVDGGDGADTDTLGVTGNDAYTYTVASGGNALARGGTTVAAFSNVENLEGGAGADVFIFGEGGGLGTDGMVDGMVDGRGGIDTLRFTGSSGVVYSTSTSGNTLMQGSTLLTGFSSVESLEGGSGADTFNIGTALSGSLTGRGGADSFVFSTTGSAASVDGGADTDTLGATGNVAYTYTVASGGGGSLRQGGAMVAAFSNIENLEGGAGADTFIFSAGGDVGNIDGGAGRNTLRATGNDAYTYRVASSGNTLARGGTTVAAFSNVENLEGGAGADVFIFGEGGGLGTDGMVDGRGGIDTLRFTGSSGVVYSTSTSGNTLMQGSTLLTGFSSVESLEGGSGADTFNIGTALSGSLTGRGGADSFVFSATGSAASVDGGDGADTDTLGVTGNDAYTYTVASGGNTLARGGTTVAAFSNVENLEGGAGADVFIFGEGGGLGTDGMVDGRGGMDTLRFTGSSGVVYSTSTSGNTLMQGSTLLTGFSSVESLEGGSGADTFNIGTALSGSLTGRGGADSFVFSTTGSAASVDGGADTDTLGATGNDAYTYTVASGGGGSLRQGGAMVAAFSNIENLQGGAGADTFIFSAGGDVGNIDGGAGRNTLRATGNDAYTYRVASSGNTLARGGTTVAAFSNVEDLEGGDGADSFNIEIAHAGNLSGGAGADTFNIEVVHTGNLSGGAGADTFVFSGSGDVEGNVDGGADTDTLRGTGNDNYTYTVASGGNTLARGATMIAAFSNVQNLEGGDGDDTFNINIAHTGILLGGRRSSDGFLLGTGSVKFNLAAELTGSLDGGFLGADILTLQPGGAVRRAPGGGSAPLVNQVRLVYQGWSDPVTVTLGGYDPHPDIGFTGMASGLLAADGSSLDASGFQTLFDLRVLNSTSTSTLQGFDLVSGQTAEFVLAAAETISNRGYFYNSPPGAVVEFRGRLSFLGIDTIQGGGGEGVDVVRSGGHLAENHIEVRGVGRGIFCEPSCVGSDPKTIWNFSRMDLLEGGEGVDTLALIVAAPTAVTSVTLGEMLRLPDTLGFDGKVEVASSSSDSEVWLEFREIDKVIVSSGKVQNILRNELVDAQGSRVRLEDRRGAAEGSGSIRYLRTGHAPQGLSYEGFNESQLFVRDLSQGSAVTVTLSGRDPEEGYSGTYSIGGGSESFTKSLGVRGTAMEDTLITQLTGESTWIIATEENSYSNGGSNGGPTYHFFEIENLQGGAGVDAFTIGAAHSGNLVGGAGDDTFQINAAVTGNVQGGEGADTFRIEAAHSGNLVGGAGDDTFRINAAVTGNVQGGEEADTIIFLSNAAVTGDVQGGEGADTFTIGAAHSGNLVGGAGNDIFQLNASVTGDVQGGAGADTFTIGAAHSGNLVGGAGDDIFQLNASVTGDVQGDEGADTFTIGAAHSGNLVGGAGNDIFEINAAVTGDVQGGAGADTFTLGSGGCVLSSGSSCSAANPTLGTISGGADQDSLSRSLATTYLLDATTAGAGTLEGIAEFSGIEKLEGGAASDTLSLTMIPATGENELVQVTLADTPTPDADGFSGRVSVAGEDRIEFEGVDVIEGNAANAARNSFKVGELRLSDRGNSVLYVDSGGTDRVLSYSNFGVVDGFLVGLTADVVRIVLTGLSTEGGAGMLYGSSSTPLRSFTNSPGVSGVDGGSHLLEVGFTVAVAGTFTISGADTGTYSRTSGGGEFSFARIGSLAGGAAAERFVLGTGGSLSGSVAGGEGVDRLVTEGAVAASFTLSAMGAGSLASGNRGFSFSGVEHLEGGSGANLLSYSGVSEAVTVTLQGRGALAGSQGQGTYLEGFTNISEVVGGDGTADRLVGDFSGGGVFTLSGSDMGNYEDLLTFSAFENLSGGAGADTFRVEEGGSVSGELHGGGGNDVLDLSELFRSGLWLVELSKVTESPATGFSGSYGQTTLRGSTRAEPAIGLDLVYLVNKLGASNSFGFTGIDELRAPRVNTSRGVFLQGTNAGGRWRLNGQYAGSYESLGTTLSFSNVRQVQGGARTDQGEAGVDILDVSAIAGPLTLFLSGDNGSLTTPDYRGNVVSGARDNGDENNTEPLVYYRGIERYAGGEEAYLLVEVLAEGRNLVVNPQSSTPAEDRPSNPILLSLTQDEGGERLQTLDEFLGAVLIGGTLFPEEVLADGEGELPLSLRPSLGESNVAQRGRGVQADTLRVEGALETRGDLYLAASNIQLVGDLAVGTETAGEFASAAGSASKVVLVAVGAKPVDSRAGAGPGNIEVQLSEGDAERTIYAGSGTLIANSGIEGANSLVLNFDGGVLRTAVSPGATRNSNPNLQSQVRPEGLTTLLRNYLAVLDLDAQEFVVILFNPTTQLSTVIGRLYLDLGLFVEELSLYGLEGAGLALFYSQCEEVESCAPEITLEKLEKLIALLEEQLAGGLVSVTGLDREVLDLRLRRARALRKELRVFLGLDAPEGVEEEEELDFEEFDLPSANLGGADRG